MSLVGGASIKTTDDTTDSTGVKISEETPFMNEPETLLSGSTEKLDDDRSLAASLSCPKDVYSPTTVTLNSDNKDSGCCFDLKSIRTKSCISCSSKLKPYMWKYNTRPQRDDAAKRRCRYGLLCPPHGFCGLLLTLFFATLVGLGVVMSIRTEDHQTLLGLYILFLACNLAGFLIQHCKLPPLLGMLVIGCVLGNVPYLDVARHIDKDWSSAIRKIALAVILTRAGLGLDPSALRRLSCVVVRLAFLPCLVEAISCMVFSHLIIGLPWIWGLMLGFVIAAVSPAVVVPSLLSLSEQGYGLNKAIPTLVIAAASIDDVLAISAFSICLGINFSSTENLALTIFKGPLEAILGVVYGIVFGIMFWYIPVKYEPAPVSKYSISQTRVDVVRSCLLLTAGILALFGSAAVGLDGAGALGCLTLPFVAALQWRKSVRKETGESGDVVLPTEAHMNYLWIIFQPLLFGLIGAAVDLRQITDFTILSKGLAVLLIGLVFRLIASFVAVFGTNLNWKERFFIPLAWLPKATVQALIGSMAYDTALSREPVDKASVDNGMTVLTIAVLCILVTAPIGAAAITLSGPRLLHKTTNEKTTIEETTGENSAVKNV